MSDPASLLGEAETAALAPARSARDAWLAAMPAVAIVLLVALTGALLYVLAQDEAERAKVRLLSDALWVEQTLRFQLSTDEDMVRRLALDAGSGDMPAATVLDRARLHVANNPEVLAIAWFGADAVSSAWCRACRPRPASRRRCAGCSA
ncbi:hypothetical protein [Methylobrevis pamukkalensis]|uniref:Uncharacterized protein n=1 Tax=Methylobrevis pamukkalensis TaxID=1439726 RepID=A0A1E3H433_9HYPH|nr:hypothetical protein [Methylobrevis pamukkalensis]ODN71078.1 hypothetical protein A6302_01570 [Methylobrevis pamukkalensis]